MSSTLTLNHFKKFKPCEPSVERVKEAFNVVNDDDPLFYKDVCVLFSFFEIQLFLVEYAGELEIPQLEALNELSPKVRNKQNYLDRIDREPENTDTIKKLWMLAVFGCMQADRGDGTLSIIEQEKELKKVIKKW